MFTDTRSCPQNLATESPLARYLANLASHARRFCSSPELTMNLDSQV
jgi:hypothetical protein